jgi:hypothetical protein
LGRFTTEADIQKASLVFDELKSRVTGTRGNQLPVSAAVTGVNLLVTRNEFAIYSNNLLNIKQLNGLAGSESQARAGQSFNANNFSFLRGHTVESCQSQSETLCVLIAEGDRYTWDYRNHRMIWNLQGEGDSLSTKLDWAPSITNFSQENAQNLYASVLQTCQEKYPRTSSDKCLVFAYDLEVVWKLRDKALTQ